MVVVEVVVVEFLKKKYIIQAAQCFQSMHIEPLGYYKSHTNYCCPHYFDGIFKLTVCLPDEQSF